jgi:uncharacterized protein
MDLLPTLSPGQWMLIVAAGFAIGLAKGGLFGVGMIPILIFAEIFPARASTGLLLLALVVGDICSLLVFHQQASWRQLRRVALPAVIGVVLGWWTLGQLEDAQMRPIIGWLILGLTAVHLSRPYLGAWVDTSTHHPIFALTMGGLGGWSTMLANAAGPVMSLFFLAMRLPKLEFVGTTAWFFFLINLCKIPFGLQLGLVNGHSLGLALVLAPVILASVYAGRWILHRIPQRLFEFMILLFAVAGALRMIL